MKIEIVKHYEVELTEEEKEVLHNTRNIIGTLIETMAEHQCENVTCRSEYGDDTIYTLAELDDADTMMAYLIQINEIL